MCSLVRIHFILYFFRLVFLSPVINGMYLALPTIDRDLDWLFLILRRPTNVGAHGANSGVGTHLLDEVDASAVMELDTASIPYLTEIQETWEA